jgi:hypothetical protein
MWPLRLRIRHVPTTTHRCTMVALQIDEATTLALASIHGDVNNPEVTSRIVQEYTTAALTVSPFVVIGGDFNATPPRTTPAPS